jgi:hypothetical protein
MIRKNETAIGIQYFDVQILQSKYSLFLYSLVTIVNRFVARYSLQSIQKLMLFRKHTNEQLKKCWPSVANYDFNEQLELTTRIIKKDQVLSWTRYQKNNLIVTNIFRYFTEFYLLILC